MNEKILSLQDIEAMEDVLARFNSFIIKYYNEIDNAIKKFETTPVTQSLYVSGNFGAAQKEYLIKLRKALEQYVDSISEPGGLVSLTKKYISTQRDLLMMESRGYTATDFVRARGEGNQ